MADLAIDLRLRADSTVASLIARRRLFARNMRARVDVTSDSTGYRFFAESRADSVHAGASIAVAPHIRLAGTLGEDTLGFAFDRADVEVSAAALVQNNRLVANPAFHANLEGSQLDVRIAATESPSIGPVDIGLVAERTDARWRMHFDRFLMIASGYSVSSAGEHEINLYRNAVAVNGLKFTSPGPAGQQQTLELAGTYSPLSTDTMSVSAHGVDLLRLSAFAGLQQPVAGAANGRVEVVRVDGIPVLAGELQVDRLGLDDRILGNLTANSRFRARGNEVDVTAVLSPVSDSLASGLNTVANDLTLDGAIRFERDGSERRTELELVADIRRADLFFFEYVFPQTIDNVEGSIVGTSTITGTLSRPEFNAQLELPAGSFTVPEFNIGLGVTGTLAVDREGIRIRRATLTDATGGIATISGSVLFNDYRFFSLDLSGDLNDLHIMNIAHSTELPFYGNIRGSGQIMLDGPISRATLRTTDARTNPESEVYIPIVAPVTTSDEAFIVFADSSGVVTDPIETERRNVLSSRPRGERSFLDGLELDLNLFAPEGTTVHLVIDPLLGDVINAVGTGRVQIRRREGEFSTFGTLNVTSGDYLFTAGDVFVRRFGIDSGGSITWDGDPTNAILDIRASYETRASRAGLPGSDGSGSAIPLIVRLRITGRVETPEVALSLEVDRTNRDLTGNYAALEAILNQPSRSTEYATSVLVSNSFLLTTSEVRTDVLASSAFNSVSQLVASQINRYLNEALPNVDFSFGVQGESTQELGVTYGIALRLLDERLVIRGQGVYQGARTETADVSNQNLEGEFVVEVKLSPTVSVEVFYRREGDVLTNNATLTGSTGAGVSYSTEFSTWRRFFSRIFGTSKSQPAEADSSIPQ